MRTIIFLTLIQFSLTITGCSKTEQPDNSAPKLLWKTPLLDGKESFSFNPVVYKDWVIYGSKYARLDHFEKPKVVAFNKNTGEKVWEWNDAQSDKEAVHAFCDVYIYQNIFVFSTGSVTYAIDLNNGKSTWTTKDPEGGNARILGIGDKIYHVRNAFDKKQDILCKANILSGNWEPVYKVQKDNRYVSIGSSKLLDKDEDGKTYIYFTASNVDLDYTESETHLMKLDTQTDSIVLDKVIPNSNSFTVVAVDDKRVYLTGIVLTGCDKKTGEILKEYSLPVNKSGVYSAGYFITSKNKIFAPTNYPRLICYDKENTSILWSEDGISTSVPSRLLYHDGVVYYTSSSDGYLHAIDENGKRLWKAVSPDRKGSGDGIFDTAITIDKEENHLYLSTYYSACCYETIKK
jgi:outer membrane protein assembly factor BamB